MREFRGRHGQAALLRSREQISDHLEGFGKVHSLKMGRVFGQVFLREAQEGSGRAGPALLEMNKSTGELNQSFVEVPNGFGANLQPYRLKHFMRFEVITTIKTLKKGKIA